jgi:hypothetical protein
MCLVDRVKRGFCPKSWPDGGGPLPMKFFVYWGKIIEYMKIHPESVNFYSFIWLKFISN